MKALALSSILLLVASISATGSAEEKQPAETAGFDVNDVSILLPLPQAGGIEIGVSAAGPHGPLLSAADFAKIPLLPAALAGTANAYGSLRILGVRLDACAPRIPASGALGDCTLSLLRLVAQPVVKENGQVKALDAALHLVYRVSLSEELVQDLGALKEIAIRGGHTTRGVPLGVHPALKNAKSDPKTARAFAEGLTAFLQKNAGTDNRIAVSVMVTKEEAAGFVWEWAKTPLDAATGRVLAPGDEGYEQAKKATAINGVDGTHYSDAFSTPKGNRAGKLSLSSTVVPAVAELLAAEQPSSEEAPEAYDQAYRVENPRELLIPEVDCASCHVATPYRLHAEARFGQAESALRYEAPAGVTAKMDPAVEKAMGERLYVVLNFGYLFDAPAISQRTVNESADVAAFLTSVFSEQ